ncbi:MAG: adenylate/guanylate cyclase domain-containing response regulator [Cyclobacteriaceae bacterium]|nr:MAG: adenylate/guanylate cyclase domain-containing response regulator [Cyclobacteriaceae bacterium]
MAKILVVDDEKDLEVLIKQKFRKQIRAKEYEFLFAGNGKEALTALKTAEDVDIVLSDINMPEMDGLTLLGHLSESSPLIKSVMVSAYGDMDNIRTAMNRGAFDFITKPIDFSDLSITMEKTLDYVRQLRKTLAAVRENNILKMYVDESVLNFMEGKDYESKLKANETVNASVIFIDICGFTAISETASPDTVVHLLNSYFEVMVKEIIEQDGYVDKFIGDAVMAVFRGDYHLDRAIDASLAVREGIQSLPSLSGSGSYRPDVTIGINSGEMISGNIGSEQLRRLDYTVIGDQVNVAQRLQAVADEGQIVISEKSYQWIKESFKCREIGEIQLKNKSKPMVIYEVLE